MKYSPSGEFVSQKIPSPLEILKVHYCVHKNPTVTERVALPAS
jgi:hypothetical protein